MRVGVSIVDIYVDDGCIDIAGSHDRVYLKIYPKAKRQKWEGGRKRKHSRGLGVESVSLRTLEPPRNHHFGSKQPTKQTPSYDGKTPNLEWGTHPTSVRGRDSESAHGIERRETDRVGDSFGVSVQPSVTSGSTNLFLMLIGAGWSCEAAKKCL